jgi:hypothetical protein
MSWQWFEQQQMIVNSPKVDEFCGTDKIVWAKDVVKVFPARLRAAGLNVAALWREVSAKLDDADDGESGGVKVPSRKRAMSQRRNTKTDDADKAPSAPRRKSAPKKSRSMSVPGGAGV